MIITLHGNDAKQYTTLFKQMYELRAKTFHKRRKWRVEVNNKQEKDNYDNLNPLYIMVVSEDYGLLASLRLLPTIGSHMLSDTFPELMDGGVIIRHPLIWESSRFCIDSDRCKEYSDGINTVTRALVLGAFKAAKASGIDSIISVADLMVERILKRIGCDIERVGQVYQYDGLKTVAGLTPVTDKTIDQLSQGLIQSKEIA